VHLQEIWRYPVKSLAGERLETVPLHLDGLAGDRLLHVEDGGGRWITARSHPKLLGLSATLGADGEPRVAGEAWAQRAERLHRQLLESLLRWPGVDVQVWTDENIAPGSVPDQQIRSALEKMHIFVALISPFFDASAYINEVEVPVAREAGMDVEIDETGHGGGPQSPVFPVRSLKISTYFSDVLAMRSGGRTGGSVFLSQAVLSR